MNMCGKWRMFMCFRRCQITGRHVRGGLVLLEMLRVAVIPDQVWSDTDESCDFFFFSFWKYLFKSLLQKPKGEATLAHNGIAWAQLTDNKTTTVEKEPISPHQGSLRKLEHHKNIYRQTYNNSMHMTSQFRNHSDSVTSLWWLMKYN